MRSSSGSGNQPTQPTRAAHPPPHEGGCLWSGGALVRSQRATRLDHVTRDGRQRSRAEVGAGAMPHLAFPPFTPLRAYQVATPCTPCPHLPIHTSKVTPPIHPSPLTPAPPLAGADHPVGLGPLRCRGLHLRAAPRLRPTLPVLLRPRPPSGALNCVAWFGVVWCGLVVWCGVAWHAWRVICPVARARHLYFLSLYMWST